jgi:hypothetical protein
MSEEEVLCTPQDLTQNKELDAWAISKPLLPSGEEMKKWNDLTPEEKANFQQKMTQIISKWATLLSQEICRNQFSQKNKEWISKNRIIN